jgi:hypothetical protein
MLKELAIVLAAFTLLATASHAQAPAAQITPAAKKTRWKKYVNKEYGFALKFPDAYQPSSDQEICKDNEYYRYLLCLVRRDDPDAKIYVTLIVGEPFAIKTNRDDTEYAVRKIGRRVFYCGTQGSMGVGFEDQCIFNLKGKTLEISYDPNQTIDTGEDVKAELQKSVESFRTF